MSVIEIIETAFEHIQATEDLQKYLKELKDDVSKEIGVPAKSSEGSCLLFLQ